MLYILIWKCVLILGLIVLGFVFVMFNLFYNKVEGYNDVIVNIECSGVEIFEDIVVCDVWFNWLFLGLVNLGLDLCGGVYFLGEVYVVDVYKVWMDVFWLELCDVLVVQCDIVGLVCRVVVFDGQLIVEISNLVQMVCVVEIVCGLVVFVILIIGVG